MNVEQKENRSFKKKINIQDPKSGEKVPVLTSISELIQTFLQKTYRYCINSKDVDITSKKSILIKTLNIYTSSQILDEDILLIKRSFIYLITKMEISRRAATIAALTTCLILYLLVRSFDYVGASASASTSKLEASVA
jgi:hypothetical protein